jgi:hypothetical protein
MPAAACRHLTHQRQIRHEPPKPSTLALQVLDLPGLVDLKAAILLAPTVIALLRDFGLFARQRHTLALRRLHLDLAQL